MYLIKKAKYLIDYKKPKKSFLSRTSQSSLQKNNREITNKNTSES